MADSRERIYFVLLGYYTGDIWHLAAAMRLWYSSQQNVDYIKKYKPVLVLIADENAKETKDMTKKAKALHRYFRHLKLPVVVHKVDTRPDSGSTYKKKIMYSAWKKSLKYDDLEDSYENQEGFNPPLDFDSIFDGLVGQRKFEQAEQGNKVFTYDLSTTVLMDLFSRFPPNECVQRLSKMMWQSGDTATDDKILKEAEVRVGKLLDVCKEVRGDDKSGQVVLFNYRVSQENQSLNSNLALMNFVKSELANGSAKAHLVPVAIGLKSDEIDELRDKGELPVFDLFGVQDPGTPPSIQDKAVTACFWTILAHRLQVNPPPPPEDLGEAFAPKDPFIRGIIGGRSGSMDIPAFVGLRAVSWDTPWWDDTYNIPGARPTIEAEIGMTARLLNAWHFTPVVWYSRDVELKSPDEIKKIGERGKKRKRGGYPTSTVLDRKPGQYVRLRDGWKDVLLAGQVTKPAVEHTHESRIEPFEVAYAKLTVELPNKLKIVPKYLNEIYTDLGITIDGNADGLAAATGGEEPEDDEPEPYPENVYPVLEGKVINYYQFVG